MSKRKEINGMVNESTHISGSRLNEALRVLQAYEIQSSCKHDANILIHEYENPDNGDLFEIKQCTKCNKIIKDGLKQKGKIQLNN